MKNSSSIFNWFVLLAGLGFIVLTLGGRTRFGHGLGDLFYMYLIQAVFIIQLVLSWIFAKQRNAKRSLITGIAFFIIYSLFFYKMTLGRGPEYHWNGKILVENTNENTQQQ